MADGNCKVKDCERTGRMQRGMCNMHYLRFKRYGDVNFVKMMKTPKGTRCNVEGCESLAVRKLMCNKHHRRVEAHGDPHYRVNATYGEPYQRVLEYLRNLPSTDECAEWPFQRCPLGYGKLRATGHDVISTQAHRYIFSKIHGEPEDKSLHCAHKCGNRACVNPRHLRWATVIENAHDRRIHGTSGHKLDKRKARKIYQATGPYKDIAERYDVSQPTVSEIKNGRTWSWATGHIRA